MTGPDPAEFGWWLASRAAGVVALLCITASVAIGLAMAGRVAANPRLSRTLMALHAQTALTGLVAIAVHGITLLGDTFLDPGLTGIAVPFVIDHARAWTGLGVTAGWLAAILGLSYWIRHRIGPRLWRAAHGATVLVYVLAVAHTLGAGTDASETWMRALVVITGAPVLFLFLMRVLPRPTGFRRLRVTAVTPESAGITSFALSPPAGGRLAPFAPGQFVPVRVAGLTRNYSLSSAPGEPAYRISVKRDGAVSGVLHAGVREGDRLEVGEPRGAFVLDDDATRPVVLLSAGVGATPVLAMLHALVRERSRREVWWLHQARCGREHAFREEVRALVAALPSGRAVVAYSRPEARDVPGRDFDLAGRFDEPALRGLGLPTRAAFHLCGTPRFCADMTAALHALGAEDVRSEAFGGGGPVSPPPPQPRAATAPQAAGGPEVAFTRSGVSVAWDRRFGTLLDLAEAHGVQAASGCRAGACGACRTPVLDGRVTHDPEPADPPPAGSALLCCARPEGDVVLDA